MEERMSESTTETPTADQHAEQGNPEAALGDAGQ